MKNLISAALMLFSVTALAQEFAPIEATSKKFKISASRQFKKQVGKNLQYCKVVTKLNEATNTIGFSMGIVGSNFDHMGWDVKIPANDLPLRAGYTLKIFTSTAMMLQYDGKTLKYDVEEGKGVFSRIYPFELVIDENLQNPKSFKGAFAGWEMSFFKPKKHVTQSCTF